MDPLLIPIVTAVITPMIALLGALLGVVVGATLTARNQFALDDRRAFRERKAHSVEPFMEWVHGRPGVCLEAILAARSGDIEEARTILDAAAKDHPFRNTRWHSVTNAQFRTAVYAFTQADEAARDLADEYVSQVQRSNTRSLVESENEQAIVRKLQMTVDELQEAADRYVYGEASLLPVSPAAPKRWWQRLRRRS